MLMVKDVDKIIADFAMENDLHISWTHHYPDFVSTVSIAKVMIHGVRVEYNKDIEWRPDSDKADILRQLSNIATAYAAEEQAAKSKTEDSPLEPKDFALMMRVLTKRNDLSPKDLLDNMDWLLCYALNTLGYCEGIDVYMEVKNRLKKEGRI